MLIDMEKYLDDPKLGFFTGETRKEGGDDE
jgi:hypothetical protein